jgi:hypothetical protein
MNKEEYQPRINIIKDENGNLLVDPESILNKWKNFFNQVLYVHGVHGIRQMDIHMAELLVPEHSLLKVEIATGNFKRYKSMGTDQILAKLIKEEGETLCSEKHKLIHSMWNMDKLPQQQKESIIVLIHKKGDKTDCNNYQGISLLSTAYKILSNILLAGLLHMSTKLLGIISVSSIATHLLLITFSTFGRCYRKNGSTMGQCISYLYTSRKPMTQLRGKFFTTLCLNFVYLRN